MSADPANNEDREFRPGQKVTFTGHGEISEYGQVRVQVTRLASTYVPTHMLDSVEPVPVVPEPGKWYRDSSGEPWWAFAGPAGHPWLMCWADSSFTLSWQDAQTNDYAIKLPLVECEPPAEFRDGQ